MFHYLISYFLTPVVILLILKLRYFGICVDSILPYVYIVFLWNLYGMED